MFLLTSCSNLIPVTVPAPVRDLQSCRPPKACLVSVNRTLDTRMGVTIWTQLFCYCDARVRILSCSVPVLFLVVVSCLDPVLSFSFWCYSSCALTLVLSCSFSSCSIPALSVSLFFLLLLLSWPASAVALVLWLARVLFWLVSYSEPASAPVPFVLFVWFWH